MAGKFSIRIITTLRRTLLRNVDDQRENYGEKDTIMTEIESQRCGRRLQTADIKLFKLESGDDGGVDSLEPFHLATHQLHRSIVCY